MKWIEFAVYTTDEGIEPVCGALAMAGLDQVSIEESGARVEAHLRELAPYWDFADAAALCGQNGPCVKAYIAQLSENLPIIENAGKAVYQLRQLTWDKDIGPLRIEKTILDEEDWANSWKQYYKPMPIGDKLLVCPSWEQVPLDQERKVLWLDPGMVFGTGAHYTTRMCLELLEGAVQSGSTILDLGCGSGILAIAALLLGAGHAVCVDIDPVAERVVRENMALNGMNEERACVYTGNVLGDRTLQQRIAGQYDIITANIVADVVIALCPHVQRLLKPGGVFICSGIVDERADDVQRALTQASFHIHNKSRNADSKSQAGALETSWVAYLAMQ